MADLAKDSDAILAAASLVGQRAATRRITGTPIGQRSAKLRRAHLLGKAKRIALAATLVLTAAFTAGLLLNGIGFTGLMLTAAALLAVTLLFAQYPRLSAPDPSTLAKAPIRALVGQAQLWLESQRPALPPPATRLLDQMGSQLDQLGLQLETLPDNTQATADIRKLLGVDLPEVLKAYQAIPAPLRATPHAGTTPNDQLTESLTKISAEITHTTRQLADTALDRLAIQSRYLDYKYGETPGKPD